jgi:hypothetical protein
MKRISGILIKPNGETPVAVPDDQQQESPTSPPSGEYGTDGTSDEPAPEPETSIRIASFILRPKQ